MPPIVQAACHAAAPCAPRGCSAVAVAARPVGAAHDARHVRCLVTGMSDPKKTDPRQHPVRPKHPPHKRKAPGHIPPTDLPDKTPEVPPQESPEKIELPRKDPGEPVPVKDR